MVRVIGWTPSSHEANPGTTVLNQFAPLFEAAEPKDRDYPLIRSGHRCFTDNEYFYVIGGYTNIVRRGSIFKEMWAMSLITFEWRRYEAKGELPEHLASFAIIQVFPYSKSFIMFGGSGTRFGSSSSNDFYLLRANNDHCSFECQKLNVESAIPQPIYGHAMCAGESPGKYYIIGGTEGVRFNFDVHALTMKANPNATSEADKVTWECEHISHNTMFAGRYRLEATYDENKHCLVFFGGGNNEEVFGFKALIVLDINTKESKEVDTTPDTEFGFPCSRRCHTIVRYGRNVVMTGGVHHSLEPEDTSVKNDVWIFNLNNYSWWKYEHSLPSPVLFHDSVITEDGWLLSFGGVDGITPTSLRNNVLHGAWFGVPTLQRFALEALRKECPNKFSGLYCGNLRLSQVIDVFNVFCKNGAIEDKEREILENGQLKFYEKVDRSRFFLNEDGEDFAVSHRPVEDEQPRRRRRGRRQRHAMPQNDLNPGLRNVLFQLQRIVDRVFLNDGGQNAEQIGDEADDDIDDDEMDEESEESEEEDGEDRNIVRINFEADDDFENGRFERIPMRQPWRRGPE